MVHQTKKTDATIQSQITGTKISTDMRRASWLSHKRGRGFELTITERKSDNKSECDLNSGPLNFKSNALTNRSCSLLPVLMRILTRGIMAVKIVMLESTHLMCLWETEKGSVLEVKHRQFLWGRTLVTVHGVCKIRVIALTDITKIKISLACLTESFSRATNKNVAEREGACDKAQRTSVWKAIHVAALFTVIYFYFRWLSRSLRSKSLPTDCRHGKW